MNGFIRASLLSLTALALLLVVNTARAESEGATKVQSATISGSEIKSGDQKTCVDGTEMVQKSLVFTTTVDGKDSNEITTRSWFEATGESCEGENAYEIPEPSDELKTMLAKESKERPNAAAGQLGGELGVPERETHRPAAKNSISSFPCGCPSPPDL